MKNTTLNTHNSIDQFTPLELLESQALAPVILDAPISSHVIFHHGNNVALKISSYNATLITTEYPLQSREEVEGLLECFQYGQEVPSTNFLHYGYKDLNLAYETYQALNSAEDHKKLVALLAVTGESV